jgi:hypothetical protein
MRRLLFLTLVLAALLGPLPSRADTLPPGRIVGSVQVVPLIPELGPAHPLGPGADVLLWYVNETAGAVSVFAETATDADGAFAFDDIPAGGFYYIALRTFQAADNLPSPCDPPLLFRMPPAYTGRIDIVCTR